MTSMDRSVVMEIAKEIDTIRSTRPDDLIYVGDSGAKLDQFKAKLSLRKIATFPADDRRVLSETRDVMSRFPSALLVFYSSDLRFDLYAVEGPKTGGCFIATAAYGSALAPEVAALRRFRDEALLSSAVGTAVTRLYEIASPPLASLVARSCVLRAATRQLLLKPMLLMLKVRTALLGAARRTRH